jgi:methanogenic corrinoid protein MtbC1
MYTIKQAAARTGLSVSTIRAWERRYGVVQPARTTAGYRLYDDESLARLIAMRHLVDEQGWRASQAAERVLADGPDLATMTEVAGLGTGSTPAEGPSPSTTSDVAVAAFLQAAGELDVPAMETILDESFAAQRFELAMDRVVFPALRAIGETWSSDEVDVAVEHAASETVRRRLARFFDAAWRGHRAPRMVVGLPPTARHEIGAFAFAVAARRAGLDVLYLGADVPLESWLRTARETAAPVVVLAVVIPSDVAPATVVVEALRSMARPPTCALGGALAHEVPASLGALLLPGSLDQAVAAVLGIH